MRGRILVLDERTPTPDQDSGSASAFALLSVLARGGYDVTFVAADLAQKGRYARALNRAGIRTPTGFKSKSLAVVLDAWAPRCDVMLLYRASLASHVFDYARRAAPKAKIVFHPVDLHFMRMQRGAALTGDAGEAESAAAMRTKELDLIGRADATIVVSSYEAELLAGILPGAVVHHIPILRGAPDTPGFAGWRYLADRLLGAVGKRRNAERPAFKDRRDVLFIGGFDHAPNVDAVLWFVREVWPRVQARGFRDKFVIAGSRMPAEVASLFSESIDVRGHVPKLAPLFDRCRLSVAPLRYGGGIKGKIVSSLSYGVPVVATSIAAEGMGLRDGMDILVADDPNALAERIVSLYGDPDLWTRLSANGYAAFASKFSETAGAAKVLAVFDGVIGASRNS
jgi:glycosyltransferase involved in cell wall biosynthesis